MKTIIKIIILTISLIGFSYLVISMVELSFNIADWKGISRRFLAFLSFIFLGISIVFVNIENIK